MGWQDQYRDIVRTSGTVSFGILKYAFTRTGLPSYETGQCDSDSDSELEDEEDVDSNGLYSLLSWSSMFERLT